MTQHVARMKAAGRNPGALRQTTNAIWLDTNLSSSVIPAKAGIQRRGADLWIPAFAGMTTKD